MNNEPIMINPNVVINQTTPFKTTNTIVVYIMITIALMLISVGTTIKLMDKPKIEKIETTSIYLDGYKYRIEEPIKASVENNTLMLFNKELNCRTLVSPIDKTLDYYKNNLNVLKKYYIDKKYQVKTPITKYINGVEYLTMEMDKDAVTYLLAITKDYITLTEVSSNIVDYKVLEDLSEVIKKSSKNKISKRLIPSEDRLINTKKVLIK